MIDNKGMTRSCEFSLSKKEGLDSGRLKDFPWKRRVDLRMVERKNFFGRHWRQRGKHKSLAGNRHRRGGK